MKILEILRPKNRHHHPRCSITRDVPSRQSRTMMVYMTANLCTQVKVVDHHQLSFGRFNLKPSPSVSQFASRIVPHFEHARHLQHLRYLFLARLMMKPVMNVMAFLPRGNDRAAHDTDGHYITLRYVTLHYIVTLRRDPV